MCRVDFTTLRRNYKLEKLIKSSKCYCENLEKGCSEPYDALKLDDHEKYCKYGRGTCPVCFDECEVLIDHLIENHHGYFGDTAYLKLRKPFEVVPLIHEASQNIFVFNVVMEGNEIRFQPRVKAGQQYRYKVQIDQDFNEGYFISCEQFRNDLLKLKTQNVLSRCFMENVICFIDVKIFEINLNFTQTFRATLVSFNQSFCK